MIHCCYFVVFLERDFLPVGVSLRVRIVFGRFSFDKKGERKGTHQTRKRGDPEVPGGRIWSWIKNKYTGLGRKEPAGPSLDGGVRQRRSN